MRAGDDAHARGELATAMAAYRSALATNEGAEHSLARECEVLIRLAEVEYLAGDPAHRASATAAARLADHLNDKDLLGRAALAAARQVEAATTRIDPERVATLRRAVDVTTSTTKARILAVLASELTAAPDPVERRRLSDQALALARECGDAQALHQVLAARASTIRAPDTLAERLANTAEDLLLTATDDDLRRRWGALSSRALTCLDAGMVTEAEDNDRLAGAIADELMVPGAQLRARFVEARDLTRVGDLGSAEQRAIQALRIGRAAGEDAAAIFVAPDLPHPLAPRTRARARAAP